jgi:hypothetical protein
MNNNFFNTGILDIRKYNGENIQEFENVGILIKKRGSVIPSSIKIKNVSYIIECDDNLIILNENICIDDFFLKSLDAVKEILCIGNISFSKDIDLSLLDQKIGNIYLTGEIKVNEDVFEIINNKIVFNSGKVKKTETSEKIYNGKVNFEDILGEFSQKIVVNGLAFALNDIEITGENEFIINGKLIIKESILKKYSDIIKVNGKKIVVADDYEFVNEIYTVNSKELSIIKNRKLFFYDTVIFEKDITTENIKSLKDIIFNSSVVIPDSISGCDVFTKVSLSDVYVYSNNLFYVDDIIEINADYLKNLKGPSEIYVKGDLEFCDDIDVDLINEKIGDIYNSGVITCSQDIYSYINQKTKIKQGVILTKEEGYNTSFIRL